MAKATIGALVRYCGHSGSFVADIHVVGNVNVVRATGPVVAQELNRFSPPTHHLIDFPTAGFWRPDLGVFVVPKGQVKELPPNSTPGE